jgi:hypothetical protein
LKIFQFVNNLLGQKVGNNVYLIKEILEVRFNAMVFKFVFREKQTGLKVTAPSGMCEIGRTDIHAIGPPPDDFGMEDIPNEFTHGQRRLAKEPLQYGHIDRNRVVNPCPKPKRNFLLVAGFDE